MMMPRHIAQFCIFQIRSLVRVRVALLSLLFAFQPGVLGPALAAPAGQHAREFGSQPPELAGRQGHLGHRQLARRQLVSVLGTRIRTNANETVGRIVDVLADTDGNVVAAVIELGGFLRIATHKVAVQWSALRFEADAGSLIATVTATRDALQVAPRFESGRPVVVFQSDRRH